MIRIYLCAQSTDNKITEQVNTYIYLGNLTFYAKEVDLDIKLNNHLKITGIINNMFRPQKTLKETRLKLYNILAIPALLYGSKN